MNNQRAAQIIHQVESWVRQTMAGESMEEVAQALATACVGTLALVSPANQRGEILGMFRENVLDNADGLADADPRYLREMDFDNQREVLAIQGAAAFGRGEAKDCNPHVDNPQPHMAAAWSGGYAEAQLGLRTAALGWQVDWAAMYQPPLEVPAGVPVVAANPASAVIADVEGVLAMANGIDQRIRELSQQSDNLLEPLYREAMAKGPYRRERIEALMDRMPRGFWRTELQVALNVMDRQDAENTPDANRAP